MSMLKRFYRGRFPQCPVPFRKEYTLGEFSCLRRAWVHARAGIAEVFRSRFVRACNSQAESGHVGVDGLILTARNLVGFRARCRHFHLSPRFG
jgi:hypothetical protein